MATLILLMLLTPKPEPLFAIKEQEDIQLIYGDEWGVRDWEHEA